MVKRAKLTLNHTEAKETDIPESVVTDQSAASETQKNLGKILILAGLTIISLIVFRQKIF